jgi:hypothetical protein
MTDGCHSVLPRIRHFLPFTFCLFLLRLYLAQRVKKLHDLIEKIGEARIELYLSALRDHGPRVQQIGMVSLEFPQMQAVGSGDKLVDCPRPRSYNSTSER